MTRSLLSLAAAVTLSAGFPGAIGGAEAAPLARNAQIATATGVTPGVWNGARVYARPIYDGAYASCEWVRVATPVGGRWRPICE